MHQFFARLSSKISYAVGTPAAFMLSVLSIVIWAVFGPMFNYSDTWQLVVNTGTTVLTFLLIFLVQYTQNRDAKSVHLKLDELIRSTKTARNEFVYLDDFTDEELSQLEADFRVLHDAQSASPTMHKLHKRIEAEHSRRASRTSQVINSILKTTVLAAHPTHRDDAADK